MVRETMIEARRPPARSLGLIGWLRANLFNSIANAVMTVALLGALFWALRGIVGWLTTARGWPAVLVNLRLFMVYLYPPAQTWRLVVAMWVIALLLGVSAGLWRRGLARGLAIAIALLLSVALIPLLLAPPSNASYPILPEVALLVGIALIPLGYALGRRLPPRASPLLSLTWLLSFPLLLTVLVAGVGAPRGAPTNALEEHILFPLIQAFNSVVPAVPTNVWGGFMLTLILTIVGILGSLPLGILLALGRRSGLPMVRLFSTLYIELIRGVPLVTFFFMGQFLLPLFMPQGLEIDNLIRAMVAVILFSAAYLAENVRGGLQSLPKGQSEAARALGLSYWQTTLLITLPQALRAVIPALVGQFISLFKDTSLVAIIGLYDFLGIARAVQAQPQWLGMPGGVWRETFFFVAVVYFIFSFIMSRVSLSIERSLGVGQR